MIIIDPVTLGDVAFARASPKWVFDKTGTLVQVPNDILAVTYDPSDLTKAPYALVEPAATNGCLYSQQVDSWDLFQATVIANAAVAPDGTMSADRVVNGGAGEQSAKGRCSFSHVAGVTYTASVFAKAGEVTAFQGVVTSIVSQAGGLVAVFDLAGGRVSSVTSGLTAVMQNVGNGWYRCSWTYTATANTSVDCVWVNLAMSASDTSKGLYLWGGQFEAGAAATSYVVTAGAAAIRAADVIASGAGLVYSNDPIDVQTYDAGATYSKDELAYDPVEHNVFQSLADGNTGKVLIDTTAWTPRGAINRWAMFDQYNNTQSTNADELIVVLSPQAIAQGLFLGNLDATEVRVSVVDQRKGVVYSLTQSLIQSTSGSSFYNFCFKRIKRKDYFFTLKLPPYANALVTICMRKIGGIVGCGMCAIGPVDEFGPALKGLSTEGKDYSSTTFNFDGTSSTVIRPYAKVMNCDVLVDNDQVEYLQGRLFAIRQRLIIYVGGQYGNTAVAGRYSSFKIVFQYNTKSLMSLTLEGAV